MTLHCLSINLETLEIQYYTDKIKAPYFGIDYMMEGDAFEDGDVRYNEDGYGCVYVEASSFELVKNNAMEFCLKMSNAFNAAAQEISLRGENDNN